MATRYFGMAAFLLVAAFQPARADFPLKLPEIQPPKLPSIKPPQIKPPKLPFKLPVGIRPYGRLKLRRGSAFLLVGAELRVGRHRERIDVVAMAIKKTKRSLTVKRRVKKLRLTISISWYDHRTVVVRIKARYGKLRVPVPSIRIRA